MKRYRLITSTLHLFIFLTAFSLQAETKIAVLGFKIGYTPAWLNTQDSENSRTATTTAIMELKRLPEILPVDRTKLLEQIKEIQLDLTGLTGLATQDATLKISDSDFLFIGSIESPAFEINRNENPDHMSDQPVEFQGKIRYQLNMEIIDKLKGDAVWAVSMACSAADYSDEKENINPDTILQRSLKIKIKEGMKNITSLTFQSPEIVSMDPLKKSVLLNMGTDHQIKKGMHFSIFSSINGNIIMQGEIKIDKVMKKTAVGRIISDSALDPSKKYFARIKNQP